MWAVPPALGPLHVLGLGARCSERLRAGAAIFEQRRLGGPIAPAKQAAPVGWMQTVKKHESESRRKSSGDATVAESRHDVGFRHAAKASLGQPCGKFGKEGFFHTAIIPPQRPVMGWPGRAPALQDVKSCGGLRSTRKAVELMSALAKAAAPALPNSAITWWRRLRGWACRTRTQKRREKLSL